jgi:hypothetical protein
MSEMDAQRPSSLSISSGSNIIASIMDSPSKIHIPVSSRDHESSARQLSRRPSSLGIIELKSKREISKYSPQIYKHRVDVLEKMQNEAIGYLNSSHPDLKMFSGSKPEQQEEECLSPLRKNYSDLKMALDSLREMNIKPEKSNKSPRRGQTTPIVLHANLSKMAKSKRKSKLLDPLIGNLPLCKDNLDQLSKLKQMPDAEPRKSIFHSLGTVGKSTAPALVQGTGLNHSKASQKPNGPMDNHQFRSAQHLRNNSN